MACFGGGSNNYKEIQVERLKFEKISVNINGKKIELMSDEGIICGKVGPVKEKKEGMSDLGKQEAEKLVKELEQKEKQLKESNKEIEVLKLQVLMLNELFEKVHLDFMEFENLEENFKTKA